MNEPHGVQQLAADLVSYDNLRRCYYWVPSEAEAHKKRCWCAGLRGVAAKQAEATPGSRAAVYVKASV